MKRYSSHEVLGLALFATFRVTPVSPDLFCCPLCRIGTPHEFSERRRRCGVSSPKNADHEEAPRMAAKTRVSEAHVQRVLAEVQAGQQTAGAEMSPEGLELLARQVRGEITVDEAVEVIAARTRARVAARMV